MSKLVSYYAYLCVFINLFINLLTLTEMAKLISVSAWVTPLEGELAATAQVLINVDRIQGVKASPSGGAFSIPTVQTAIDYTYNQANNWQNGSYFVTEAVSAILAAASA
jgi:hypothetical protein